MEKREILFYIVTVASLIAFVYVASRVILQSNNPRLGGLTGNVVLGLDNTHKIGDKLTGEIILDLEETGGYGFLLLTRRNNPILTETFSLEEISKKDGTGRYVVNLEDFIDYKFEDAGEYELLFSVSDLNVNVRKRFAVE